MARHFRGWDPVMVLTAGGEEEGEEEKGGEGESQRSEGNQTLEADPRTGEATKSASNPADEEVVVVTRGEGRVLKQPLAADELATEGGTTPPAASGKAQNAERATGGSPASEAKASRSCKENNEAVKRKRDITADEEQLSRLAGSGENRPPAQAGSSMAALVAAAHSPAAQGIKGRETTVSRTPVCAGMVMQARFAC